MDSQQIRRSFVEFFTARGHAHVPSASLIPSDPAILLTNAGMVPFKTYMMGLEKSLAGQPKRGLVARQPPSSVSITHWLRFNWRRVLSTASASDFRDSEISSVVMLRCSASSEMIDAPSSRPIQRAYTLVYCRAA